MRKADGSWGITSNNIHGNYGPGGAVEDQAPDYTGARWAPSGIRLNMGMAVPLILTVMWIWQ